MKEKYNIFFFLFSFTLLMVSCEKVDKYEIIGTYEIDKYIEKDITVKENIYDLLILNDDFTFELKNNMSNQFNLDKGRWEIVSSSYSTNFSKRKEPKVKLKFYYHNRIIIALMKGTIIYFNYPNDLYNGRFQSILYVKTSNDNVSDLAK